MAEYLAENFSVTSTSGRQFRVIKELGRIAGVGRICCDGESVDVQISRIDGSTRNEMKARLISGEKLNFVREEGWRIGDVLITTVAAGTVSGRIFLK